MNCKLNTPSDPNQQNRDNRTTFVIMHGIKNLEAYNIGPIYFEIKELVPYYWQGVINYRSKHREGGLLNAVSSLFESGLVSLWSGHRGVGG